ncbi:Uncharacterised protein [Vibrio cholerae]|uniref:Uncharacterized protein n=1 Tax=Vibrio cholerae TaxID=666 RepID=A0A655TRD2_VIBCL|nr:Uncharacterised protein [Vibrio cholerae]CSB38595.1 Uncharacterised protein [Vibrio cholerae]
MRNEWQFDWTRTCSNDRVIESYDSFALFAFHFNSVRAGEFTVAVHYVHFTHFCHTSQTTGQLIDHFFFPQTNFVDVCLWLAKHDTVLSQRFGFFNHFCHVQQCFRRNTTNVQTHTT